MDQANFQIFRCDRCGAKNKIPAEKLGATAKCGKCGSRLGLGAKAETEKGINTYTIRCASCRAKNRIPAVKISETARCGKCKAVLETEDLLRGSPMMVTDANFDSTVLNSPLPVLLYFWSAGCPGCQMTGPVVDQFAAESKGRVRVAKLNVETSPGVASRYNVLGVPFLMIFDNGQLKESLPGAVRKQEIMMRMARYI
jgi:thioredoxin 2